MSEVGTPEVDGPVAILGRLMASLESNRVGSGLLALYHQNSKANAKQAITIPAAITMNTPPEIPKYTLSFNYLEWLRLTYVLDGDSICLIVLSVANFLLGVLVPPNLL